MAFEPSEKQALEHGLEGNSMGSTAHAMLSLAQSAPVSSQSIEDILSSRSYSEGGAPHEIEAIDSNRMKMGHDRRTGFELLGSPSSPSLFISQHPRKRWQINNSPVTRSRY